MKSTGLEFKIMEMAKRIADLREIVGLSVEEMAKKTGITEEEYLLAEISSLRAENKLVFLFVCIEEMLLGEIEEFNKLLHSRVGKGSFVFTGLLVKGAVQDFLRS